MRSGVSETVAMRISGHRTREIFSRYDVTSESDLQAATQKQAAYLDGISGEVNTLAYFPANNEKGASTANAR